MESASWLSYTLFGGLLPFWGTALILLFVNREQPFNAYFANGELAVFCAGLIASAIPVMRRHVKDARLEHPGWFHFVSLLSLAVILILFASVTLTRQLDPITPTGSSNQPRLNDGVIIVASFILFFVSVTIGFFVELINNVRITATDVQEFEERREETLDAAFELAQHEQHE